MSKEAQMTAAELRSAVDEQVRELMAKVSGAMNGARAGAIIADSEEIVRQAMGEFRKQVYERAVQIMADKAAKAVFSPGGSCGQRPAAAEQGGTRGGPSDG